MRQFSIAGFASQVLHYLSALDRRRGVLWSVFLWYLAMLVRYGCRDLSLWLTTTGLAMIVGTVLAFNAVPEGGRIRDLGTWSLFRFFLIPFCVASFSAFAKGHAFVLIFPVNVAANVTGGGLVSLFWILVYLARLRRKFRDRVRPGPLCRGDSAV